MISISVFLLIYAYIISTNYNYKYLSFIYNYFLRMLYKYAKRPLHI